jgi:hypothetical protein
MSSQLLLRLIAQAAPAFNNNHNNTKASSSSDWTSQKSQ